MARTSGGRWAYLAEIERQKAETERHRDQYGSRGALKALGGTILDLGKTLGVEYAKYKMGGEQKADLDVAKTLTEGERAARLSAGTNIIEDVRWGGPEGGASGKFDPKYYGKLPSGAGLRIGGKGEYGFEITKGHKPGSKGSGTRPKVDYVNELSKATAQREHAEEALDGLIAKGEGNSARAKRLRKTIPDMLEKEQLYHDMVYPAGRGVPHATEVTPSPAKTEADQRFDLSASTQGIKSLTNSERSSTLLGAINSTRFREAMDALGSEKGYSEEEIDRQIAKMGAAALKDGRKTLSKILRMGGSSPTVGPMILSAIGDELDRAMVVLATERGTGKPHKRVAP